MGSGRRSPLASRPVISAGRKNDAPFEPCRCAAVLPARTIAHSNWQRLRSLNGRGGIPSDGRE